MTALIFAPRQYADRFDEHGCVVPEKWQGATLGLNANQIEIADGPGEQADAVVQILHGWNGRFAADEITIGVPDPKLVPYLRQRLDEAGVPVRHGAGMPIERSGPYQLLAEAAEFLDRRRFRRSGRVGPPSGDGQMARANRSQSRLADSARQFSCGPSAGGTESQTVCVGRIRARKCGSCRAKCMHC